MAVYVKHVWVVGEVITKALMDNLETQYDRALEEQTHEFWIPWVWTGGGLSFENAYPVAVLNNGQTAYMSFKVPHDWTSIDNAEIVVIPSATQAAANWDIVSTYAAEGEDESTHSENDVATTYNVVNDQIFAVDISGILTGIAADDYVGISILVSTAGHNVHVLGLRFKWS